jgi:hypothetical protein
MVAPAAAAGGETPTCRQTEPVRAQPPPDPNADEFGFGPWQINDDRTIWATWGTGRMKAARKDNKGNKVLWIRPAGTRLVVSGRRLDAPAPALKATLPCCYPTGFQASGLTFPTEGCWQIEAEAGASKLTFVTRVARDETPR